MKRLYYLITITLLLYSCQPKHGEYRIYPLSPFTDSVTFAKDEDISQNLRSGIKIQYYIIDEKMERNEKSRLRIQAFIESRLKQDIKKAKAIYFTFYTGSFTFNKNSIQSKSELLSKHIDDKFAEFEYINGKLHNFDLYKDGTYYTAKLKDWIIK